MCGSNIGARPGTFSAYGVGSPDPIALRTVLLGGPRFRAIRRILLLSVWRARPIASRPSTGIVSRGVVIRALRRSMRSESPSGGPLSGCQLRLGGQLSGPKEQSRPSELSASPVTPSSDGRRRATQTTAAPTSTTASRPRRASCRGGQARSAWLHNGMRPTDPQRQTRRRETEARGEQVPCPSRPKSYSVSSQMET